MPIQQTITPADAFKALSHPTRVRVFEIIRAGHRPHKACRREDRPRNIPPEAVCVCEIIEQIHVAPATISHHLKELRNAALVKVFPHGQWTYYTVRESTLEHLCQYLAPEHAG